MHKSVIFGFTPVAKELIKLIQNQPYKLLVACLDERSFVEAKESGLCSVLLERLDDKELLECGISGGVSDIFCVSDNDDENLFITLSARELDGGVNILARASDADSKKKLLLAGANEIIDFNEIAANRAFHILSRPAVLQFLDSVLDVAGDGEYALFELEVEEGSKAQNNHLSSLRIDTRYDAALIAVLDNQISKRIVFNLSSFDHFLDAGDVVVVLAKKECAKLLKEEFIGGKG